MPQPPEHELRNLHIHRAAADAGHILAAQAAIGLFHGHLGGIARATSSKFLFLTSGACSGIFVFSRLMFLFAIVHTLHSASVLFPSSSFLLGIHSGTTDGLVEIHLVAVEVRAVHASKLGLAVHSQHIEAVLALCALDEVFLLERAAQVLFVGVDGEGRVIAVQVVDVDGDLLTALLRLPLVCLPMTSAAAASTSTMMRAMMPLLFFFCISLSPSLAENSLAEKCRL
mgnify:CR=1 FL=1